MAQVLGLLAIASLAASVILYWHYRYARTVVLAFAEAAVAGLDDKSPTSVARQLASHIHFKVPRQQDDPLFLNRWFASLGACPVTLIRDGGCCSGLSRLLIVSLHGLGIPAAQVTLVHKTERYRHCLVEARIGNGDALLLDPKFAMSYHSIAGKPISLDDLRAGVSPIFHPLPGRRRAAYPNHPLYDWDYRRTMTANWVKSMPRRSAYRLLRKITRGAIDEWRQPVVLEWPQLVLAMSALIAAMGLASLTLVLR